MVNLDPSAPCVFKFGQRWPPACGYDATVDGANLEATVETRYVKLDDFERLKLDHQELTSQVAVLTAVVGGMTCAGTIDFDRLEECVTFALKVVHPRTRPLFLARASVVMEDLEKMQQALAIEKRKSRGFKSQRRDSAPPAG